MSEPEENKTPDREPIQKLPPIPSGSLRLDIALGEGGIPCGQFVEISGDESSGKTTLCQHIIAEAQRMGRLCAWIDADHTFNPGYARRCGVELEELYIAGPAHAEQALDILEVLGGRTAGSVVVLDSVDALTPRGEFDLPLGRMPLRSTGSEESREELLSLALRRLSPLMVKNQTTIVLTGRAQTRGSEAYHQLSTHLSRLALKLHAGLRIRLQVVDLIRRDERVIGQRLQAKILKNNNISPTHPVEFDIIYDQGINHHGEVFDLGLQLGLIRKQGEEYTFRSLSLGTERRQAIETLERRALIEPMEQVVRQKLLRRLFLAET
jgi:recombination protein RecA